MAPSSRKAPSKPRLAEFRSSGGRLYGVCVFDIVADGLSAVYSFYEPLRVKDSPGSYMILSLLGDARERALPYLYLGYWIDGCDKMDYKARFRPAGGAWRRRLDDPGRS